LFPDSDEFFSARVIALWDSSSAVRHTPTSVPNLWRIERLVPGGRGLARLADGRVGLAPGVAPGDEVRVTEQREHRQFVEAKQLEVLTWGPGRAAPECPHYGHCGGCDLMHLSRAAELTAKRQMLLDALQRVGKLRELPPIECVDALGADLAYRARQRVHILPSGKVGLFARGSHEVVPVEECSVSLPAVVAGIVSLRQCLNAHPEAAAWFAEAEIRVAAAPPHSALVLTPRRQASEARRAKKRARSKRPVALDTSGLERSRRTPLAAFFTLLEQHFDLVCESRDEERVQLWQVTEELWLEVPVASFVQVNPRMNRALVERLVDGVLGRGVGRFLDIYAGAGNFAVPLSKQGLSGLALEENEAAVRAGRRNAEQAGVSGRLSFQAGDAQRLLGRFLANHGYELAIVDPPRQGALGVVAELARLEPSHIAYCACDPVSLARDVRALTERGYRLTELVLFDMFPRTHHFETLAWLLRDEGVVESKASPPP
jgi:23S rRNA (uracil1939-C5)-methyltransferase